MELADILGREPGFWEFKSPLAHQNLLKYDSCDLNAKWHSNDETRRYW